MDPVDSPRPRDFNRGFSGFTDKQIGIIDFYNRKFDRTISELQLFEGLVPIGKRKYKFVSTFASECINEVAEHIIKSSNADIGIVVNLKSDRVSFRKAREVEFDLSALAEKISQGGGHKYAAGGQICDTFLAFTKMLSPVK